MVRVIELQQIGPERLRSFDVCEVGKLGRLVPPDLVLWQ
jgi:hypothetical protein